MPQKTKTIIVESGEETLQAIAFGALVKPGWNVKYAGDKMLIAYTTRKWNKWNDEITVETNGNQLVIKSKLIHGETWDIAGRNKKHLNEFTEAFEAVKATAGETEISNWQREIAALKEETIKEAHEQASRYKEADKVMNFSAGKMYITYSIIAINTGIFLLMVAKGVDFFSPLPLDVLKWGGSLPALTLGGDWWRLISSTFLHFGIIHLALNMYALYFIGSYLEPMLGKFRYAVAYLCAGVGASLVSVLWHNGEIIVSAGASGAIFGMFGVFLALLTTNIIPKHIKGQLTQSILIFVAYNVYYGFRKGSGVDNSAHLGGLFGGMLIGYLYYLTFKQPEAKKTQMITAAVAVITVLISFVVLKKEQLPPTEVNYTSGAIISQNGKLLQEKLDSFAVFEANALAVDTVEGNTREKVLSGLQSISVPAWEKASAVIDEAEKYAESDEQKALIKKFKEYTGLRIKLTDLRIRAFKENTNGYDNEIDGLVKQIQAILHDENETEEPPKTN